MSKFTEKTTGVFVTTEDIVTVKQEDIIFLKEQASLLPRRRARICAHRNNDDPLHEMIIVLSIDTYIRPHKHLAKSESFHVIEGCADIIIFKENGDILEVIPLGQGGYFFYRLSKSYYHTMIIKSPYFVIHETTNGPFDPSVSIYAPFAPSEDNRESAKEYIESIRSLIDKNRESL